MLKATTLQTAELLDILPDEDVSIVNALIKKTRHCVGSGLYKGNCKRKGIA